MAKVFKEEQEQCSIISTYYAIEKNANLEPDQDLELKQKFLEVYPNIAQMIGILLFSIKQRLLRIR